MKNCSRNLASAVIFTGLVVSGCSERKAEISGFNDLQSQVERGPIGYDSDSWIEYKNLSGEWERTGLIFGYQGDFEECQKAIAGMKSANPAAEYRCVPANHK